LKLSYFISRLEFLDLSKMENIKKNQHKSAQIDRRPKKRAFGDITNISANKENLIDLSFSKRKKTQDSIQVISNITNLSRSSDFVKLEQKTNEQIDDDIIILDDSFPSLFSQNELKDQKKDVIAKIESLQSNFSSSKAVIDVQETQSSNIVLPSTSSSHLDPLQSNILLSEPTTADPITKSDLQLHGGVRGRTTNWINKREDYECDLNRLSKRMFSILETKPDLDNLNLKKIKKPKGLKVKLMDHQIRSLPWLEWRENSFPNGAILGNYTILIIFVLSDH
jgi:hypothetical protein